VSASPSGQQFEIGFENQLATIVEVGGGIREYEVGGEAVLDPYPLDEMCDGAHGAVLIPWPNRLADGTYRFEGTDYQVALNEPEKHNAIHGFLRWRSWHASEHSASRVVMTTALHPMMGYPFNLDVAVSYELGKSGLVVSTMVTNVGPTTCPYGCGHHPYLSPGSGVIDDCILTFEAGSRILTDDERQLPIGSEVVAGTSFDFSGSRIIGDQKIDFAFRGLARDAAGRAWVRLTRPDGHEVGLWVDEQYPTIEIYTGDTLSPRRRRHGLGIEPMTCAPNAFQSGDGLRVLAPGATMVTTWGVLFT
jgi:aldose 1-epimerase